MPTKILVLGGTRFIGKALVDKLCLMNYEVTLTSKRSLDSKPGLKQVTCLRKDFGTMRLNLDQFDYVFDFNAYTDGDFKDLPVGDPRIRYFLISTNWIFKYNQLALDQEMKFSQPEEAYISAKANLEILGTERFGRKFTAIRFPVVIGTGDHHKRLDYYERKIMAQARILIVGSDPFINFIWVDDLVELLCRLIENRRHQMNIVTITPARLNTYFSFMSELAVVLARKIEIVRVDTGFAHKELAEIIAADVLLKEVYEVPSECNIWNLESYSPIPITAKMPRIDLRSKLSQDQETALAKEKEFLSEPY